MFCESIFISVICVCCCTEFQSEQKQIPLKTPKAVLYIGGDFTGDSLDAPPLRPIVIPTDCKGGLKVCVEPKEIVGHELLFQYQIDDENVYESNPEHKLEGLLPGKHRVRVRCGVNEGQNYRWSSYSNPMEFYLSPGTKVEEIKRCGCLPRGYVFKKERRAATKDSECRCPKIRAHECACEGNEKENSGSASKKVEIEISSFASCFWECLSACFADQSKTDSNNQEDQSTATEYFFAAPAHFPIREYDRNGNLLEREGVVIYEDMEFVDRGQGNYEIRFNIGTPELPSEIRLQIQFRKDNCSDWHTISIPPMCFKDEVDCGLKCKTITIKGHSKILEEVECIDFIRRTGTARFGYGLSGLSQSREIHEE